MTKEQFDILLPLLKNWLLAISRHEQAVIDMQWLQAESKSQHQAIKDEFKAANTGLTMAAAMLFTHPKLCEDIRKNVLKFADRGIVE